MDLADSPLSTLEAYDCTLPIIASNRSSKEGGEADPTGRLEVLDAATDVQSVEAIEVNLASVTEAGNSIIQAARHEGIRTIAAVHDCNGTPPASELLELGRLAGDVAKIGVTVLDVGDVLRVLSVTRELTTDGYRVATIAMGEPGRHSRVIAPFYGSRIGYAPVRERAATSPGEIDLETHREVYETLK